MVGKEEEKTDSGDLTKSTFDHCAYVGIEGPGQGQVQNNAKFR